MTAGRIGFWPPGRTREQRRHRARWAAGQGQGGSGSRLDEPRSMERGDRRQSDRRFPVRAGSRQAHDRARQRRRDREYLEHIPRTEMRARPTTARRRLGSNPWRWSGRRNSPATAYVRARWLPGFTRTEILTSMRPEVLEKMTAPVPLKRLGLPEEIAQAVLFHFRERLLHRPLSRDRRRPAALDDVAWRPIQAISVGIQAERLADPAAGGDHARDRG